MRTIEQKNLTDMAETKLDSPLWEMSSGPVAHVAYHEMADTPVVQLDALAQLENNLVMLEDLQARMGFMMREVRGLMKL